MDDLKATYDTIASDWDRDHKQDQWWKAEIENYLALVPSGGSILDLGCGPGHKSAFFAARGYQVHGVDLSDKMIDIARRDVQNATFEVLDMYELPVLDRQFDSVFACASLLHIPKKDVTHILLSIAAILKPGGTCYVSVKEMRPDRPEETVATENDYGYEYSRFFSYFTRDELRTYFKNAGMVVKYEAAIETGNTNWLVTIGQRP